MWGICLGAQLLAIAAGRRGLPAQTSRGGLDDDRKGRRRSAPARHLVAVRRLQLARLLMQVCRRPRISSPPAATACRSSAPAAGRGDAVPSRGGCRDGAALGARTPPRNRSTSAQGSSTGSAGTPTSGCRRTRRSAAASPRTSARHVWAAARLTRRSGSVRDEGDACASPSCTRFRAAPRGGGLVKGAMGWYLEVPARGRGVWRGTPPRNRYITTTPAVETTPAVLSKRKRYPRPSGDSRHPVL